MQKYIDRLACVALKPPEALRDTLGKAFCLTGNGEAASPIDYEEYMAATMMARPIYGSHHDG